jgi:hypothetical protein
MTADSKYAHYYLTVENIRGVQGNISDVSSVPGETLSEAVQKFLRNILKDDSITVTVEIHETEVRKL